MKNVKQFLILCTVLLSTSIFAQDVDLNKGLVGLWSFDDPANYHKDYSSFGNNGIDTGAVFIEDGQFGNAIRFDGKSVFRVYNTIEDNPELNFLSEGTASLWYRTSSESNNDWRSIVRHEGHFTPLQMMSDGKAWNVIFTDSTNNYNGRAFTWDPAFFSDGEWHHIVVTFKGGEITGEDSVHVDVWMDGVHMWDDEPAKVFGHKLITKNGSQPWCFGATEHPISGGGENWTGDLDQIRLYNRALTVEEVEELYDNDKVITSVNEISNSIPVNYQLNQNYPNPFNPATKIEFSIVENANVCLEVYNVLGEKVEVLVNKELTSGTYEVKFDASNLASGIYYYTLKANDFITTKKMVLTK